MKKIFMAILNGLNKIKFLSFEKISVVYILITSIIIFLNYNTIPHAYTLITFRVTLFLLIVLFTVLSAVFDKKAILFARYALIGISLIYWYPETFDINRVFINLDYKIAALEQSMFGFQPAQVFQDVFANKNLSELFHFGYFAYYPIIIGVGLYLFVADRKNIEKYVFYVIFSFYAFYLFFILFPTAGPQYYFPAIGIENVNVGVFPEINQYFNHHVKLQSSENGSGLFFQLVELSQQLGERPTAAFPSSHVGITTIIMLFLFKEKHYVLSFILFPIYVILITSTVYIQAHYAVDVFAGLLSAFILLVICGWLFPIFSRRFELNQFVNGKLSAILEN